MLLIDDKTQRRLYRTMRSGAIAHYKNNRYTQEWLEVLADEYLELEPSKRAILLTPHGSVDVGLKEEVEKLGELPRWAQITYKLSDKKFKHMIIHASGDVE